MHIFIRIISLTLNHRWLTIKALACVTGATAAYLFLPWLFGMAIDQTVKVISGNTSSTSAILQIAIVILILSLLRGLLTFGQTYYGEKLSQSVAYDLRNKFYNHVQNLSFEFHDTNHTGNLMSRAITDVEAFRMFIMAGLVRSPYYLILFIASSTILIWRDWRLGLVALLFMPALGTLTTILRLHLRRIWLRIQEDMAELSTVLQENMTGARVVKAFAAEEYEEAKYDHSSSAVSFDMIRAARLQALNTSIIVFIYLITIGLILWAGGLRVINGDITPGDLASFLFYMQILAMPVRQAGMVVNSYARAFSAGERLFEVLDYESHVRESKKPKTLPHTEGKVIFEDVSFSYDGHTPILQNINLTGEKGKIIAIVGAPGSGKSTLVNLLPRFYDVRFGRITIDGIDIRQASLNSLRSNIGIVQQDVFLFTTSLKENIAYGRPQASMKEIISAAKIAQLDDFINTLEDGYETMVGERGSTLSGGQRQRMSIARAVLLDPSILILDDSTASVDAQTEELIQKALESLMHGRTTFVIANRLSTVHKADEIIVLDHGKIVERGSHETLISHQGIYRQIYDLQLKPQEDVMMEFEVNENEPTEVTTS